MKKNNIYDLYKRYNFVSYNNQGLLKPVHSALYHYLVNLCNERGWPERLSFDKPLAMAVVGISNRETFDKAFKGLEQYKLVRVLQRKKNQNTSYIISFACGKNPQTTPQAYQQAHQQAGGQALNAYIDYSTLLLINPITVEKFFAIAKEQDELQIELNDFMTEKLKSKPQKADRIPFQTFWDAYDKKVSRPECEKKWARLNLSKQQKAIDYLPAYKIAEPRKKFRKNPSTYLNNESWNDEIIKDEKPQSNGNTTKQAPNWGAELFGNADQGASAEYASTVPTSDSGEKFTHYEEYNGE